MLSASGFGCGVVERWKVEGGHPGSGKTAQMRASRMRRYKVRIEYSPEKALFPSLQQTCDDLPGWA